MSTASSLPFSVRLVPQRPRGSPLPPLPPTALPPPLLSAGLHALTPANTPDVPCAHALRPSSLHATYCLHPPSPPTTPRATPPPSPRISPPRRRRFLHRTDSSKGGEEPNESADDDGDDDDEDSSNPDDSNETKNPEEEEFLAVPLAQLQFAARSSRNLTRHVWHEAAKRRRRDPVTVPEELLEELAVTEAALPDKRAEGDANGPLVQTRQGRLRKRHGSLRGTVPRATNALAAVMTDPAERPLLAVPLEGTLNSVSLLSLPATATPRHDSVSAGPVTLAPNVVASMQVPRASAMDMVVHIAASSACGTDPAALTILSRNTATTAVLKESELHVVDHVQLPGLLHASMNPVTGAETAMLTHTGLHVLPTDRMTKITSIDPHGRDVQPVAGGVVRFHGVQYGPHPRTLLLWSTRRAGLHDLRAPTTTVSHLFSPTADWQLGHPHNALCALMPLPDRRVHAIAATPTQTVLFDLRATAHPLLVVDEPRAAPFRLVAAAPLRGGHVLALGRPQTGALRVLQTTPTDPFEMPLLPDGSPVPPLAGVSWAAPPIDALESGVPPPRVGAAGLAVVAEPFGEGAAPSAVAGSGVAQACVAVWNPADGLRVHALSSEPDVAKQRSRRVVDRGPLLDSAVAMRNTRERLRRSGHLFDRTCAESWQGVHPVTKTWPGSKMLMDTRKIPWVEGLDARLRVMDGVDDDVERDADGMRLHHGMRFARPRMGDLAVVCKMREAVLANGETNGEGNAGKERTPAPTQEPSNGRARVNGGTAGKDDADEERTAAPTQETSNGHAHANGDAGANGTTADAGRGLEDGDAVGRVEPQLEEILRRRGGWTIDEVAREIRGGMGHCNTPVEISALRDALDQAEFLYSEELRWHARCPGGKACHEGVECAVVVGGDDMRETIAVPDWLPQRVYYVADDDDGPDSYLGTDGDGRGGAGSQGSGGGAVRANGSAAAELHVSDRSMFGQLLNRMHEKFFEE